MTPMIVLADAGDPRSAAPRASAGDREKAGSAFDAAMGAAKKGPPAKADGQHAAKSAKVADEPKAEGSAADDALAAEAAKADALAVEAEGTASGSVREVADEENSEAADEKETKGATALADLLPDLRVLPDAAAAAAIAAAQSGAAPVQRQPVSGPVGAGSGLPPAMRLAKVLAASFEAGAAAQGEVKAEAGAKADAKTRADAALLAEAEPAPAAMPTDDAVSLASTSGATIARATDAATLRAAAALKPADAGIAAAKIDVVAMRTHFEPHRHDPVLLDEEGRAGPGDASAEGEDGAEALLAAVKGRSVEAASLDAAAGGEGYGSPSSQIASAVASLVDPRDGQASARESTAAGVLRYQAGGAALKSIRIQLQPEHLGKVDVSLRMVRGELAVEIVTPLDATAATLQEDADGLKTLLRRAGFTLDDAAVTIVVRDLAGVGGAASASASTSDTGRSGADASGQGASAGGRSAGEEASAGSGRREAREQAGRGETVAAGGAEAGSSRRAGGSLYL